MEIAMITEKHKELFELTNYIADAILDMSEREILSDLEQDGIIVKDEGRAFDRLLENTRMGQVSHFGLETGK